jgi:aminotransferase
MTVESTVSRAVGADRTSGVAESVIREMTREAHRHDAINLSQGLPDESETPAAVTDAAAAAVDAGNQYSVTWGLRELREAVSERYEDWKGVRYDPETEVTITCGTSEAIMSAMLALCDPGDGVIYFEPTYENYIPSVRFAGGEPLPVDITDGLAVDRDAFKAAAREAMGDRDEAEYLDPDAIAESYWHLVEQDRSAWTLELDLRPHVEAF